MREPWEVVEEDLRSGEDGDNRRLGVINKEESGGPETTRLGSRYCNCCGRSGLFSVELERTRAGFRRGVIGDSGVGDVPANFSNFERNELTGGMFSSEDIVPTVCFSGQRRQINSPFEL